MFTKTMTFITHRFMHWFALINGIIIVGGGAFLIYLAFFEGSHVVTFPQAPLMTVQPNFDSKGEFIEKKVFYTGENLTYGLEFCKTRSVPAEVYGFYIDTVQIAMPVLVINSPVGCHKTISDTFKIPKILPSGKYHFEVELRYHVNPLRTVIVKYRTEDFEIINNDIKGNI